MYDFIKNELKVVKILKILDKFLKFLKTDRNTFFTYVLTLVTAYLVVDRVVEMLLMIFTGMGHSYWGGRISSTASLNPIISDSIFFNGLTLG